MLIQGLRAIAASPLPDFSSWMPQRDGKGMDITCNAVRRRGTTTHAYDKWAVDELHNHARPAGRIRDTN